MSDVVLVKCPHCKTDQSVVLSAQYHPQIFTCNADIGGCDEYFVVRGHREWKCEVAKLEPFSPEVPG